MNSTVDIASDQVMSNAARTIRQWDASICRHSDGHGDWPQSICCNCLNRGFKKAHIVDIAEFRKENRSEFAVRKLCSTKFVMNHIVRYFSWDAKVEKFIADFESITVYRSNWSRLRNISSIQEHRLHDVAFEINYWFINFEESIYIFGSVNCIANNCDIDSMPENTN